MLGGFVVPESRQAIFGIWHGGCWRGLALGLLVQAVLGLGVGGPGSPGTDGIPEALLSPGGENRPSSIAFALLRPGRRELKGRGNSGLWAGTAGCEARTTAAKWVCQLGVRALPVRLIVGRFW